jgi:Replication-relaxation
MANVKVSFDSVVFQDRDFALLRGLFECRVMTASHIATLYFDGKREYTKKRLQKLKAAGFIRERKRQMSEKSVLFLTRKSFVALKNHGQLSEYPSLALTALEKRANVSDKTLHHELEVMDVKAAFYTAIAKSDKFSIAHFSTWPQLYEFTAVRSGHGAEILVKPDGFIRFHEKEPDGIYERPFFLEVDRSTESQDILVDRASCYVDFYRSGGFAVRNGFPRSEFQKVSFRVLMVFKSAERRNNTAERLLNNNPPIRSQIYLTTFAEVTTDPLGPIWIEPKDYRTVTDGTPFDTSRQLPSYAYRRQTEREALVESKIRKFRLFEN